MIFLPFQQYISHTEPMEDDNERLSAMNPVSGLKGFCIQWDFNPTTKQPVLKPTEASLLQRRRSTHVGIENAEP